MALPLLLGGAALLGASAIPGRAHFVPISEDGEDQTERPELEPTAGPIVPRGEKIPPRG